MKALKFTEEDRETLFTRKLLKIRLGKACSVEWFLAEFAIPSRCKGRLIAGADILRALSSPPSTRQSTEEKPRTARAARRPKAPQQQPATMGEVKPQSTRNNPDA